MFLNCTYKKVNKFATKKKKKFNDLFNKMWKKYNIYIYNHLSNNIFSF